MKKALVVGGSNGIGLSIAIALSDSYDVTVFDKIPPEPEWKEKLHYEHIDLTHEDYTVFDHYLDADVLMITAGFGRLALFEDIEEQTIPLYFQVNTIPVLRIIKRFYQRLLSDSNFYCGVMVSISGYMSSPFYSVYGATKAALRIFIESVNVELEKSGSTNRILNVSPGSIKGTRFNGGKENDIETLRPLTHDILLHLFAKDDLFIPQYDETFHEVLERYHQDFRAEGRHSYDYKKKRLESKDSNNL